MSSATDVPPTVKLTLYALLWVPTVGKEVPLRFR